MLSQANGRKYHFIKVAPTSLLRPINDGTLYQRKWDGISTEVFIEEDGPKIIGKGILDNKESDFTSKFPEIIRELVQLSLPIGTDFLPELIVINPKTGKDECRLTQTRVGRTSNVNLFAGLYPAMLVIHDVASIAGIDVSQRPYLNRIDTIRQYITGKSRNIFIIGNSVNGKAEWEYVLQHKQEGLIMRDPGAILGERIWKLKRSFTEDIYCKGEFEESESSFADVEYELGGQKRKGLFKNIVCYQLTKERKEVQVCELGGGFEIIDRIKIQKMLSSKLITRENPLVIEVKANMRYENLKLRHPTFLRIRIDKPWQQCTIQEEP
jgi:ATP-dependent DNA ligase